MNAVKVGGILASGTSPPESLFDVALIEAKMIHVH